MNILSRLTKPKNSEQSPDVVENRDSQKARYTRVLTGEDSNSESRSSCKKAWKILQQNMAMVPGGSVELTSQSLNSSHNDRILAQVVEHTEAVDVASFYIDKTAVTNLDFLAFVKSGGYQLMDFWPQEIWSNVVQFVDQSGEPGPRWWKDGHPPRDIANHPVVGVSWYEAAAFAKWAGKQLPTSAQWQRAATWHACNQGKSAGWKFPWGDTFEPERVNVWASHVGKTTPVNKYPGGCTPNGVFQLIGNVWEWQNEEFYSQGVDADDQPEWGELRGGAFDTYMPTQATCQFRSGQQRLWREQNVGFRCIVISSELTHIPENV